MHTITQIAFKGGVGKTSTTVNLAAAAVRAGFETLIVDFDPQSSATHYAARNVEIEEDVTHALKHPGKAHQAIYGLEEGYWIMPSSRRMEDLKMEFVLNRQVGDDEEYDQKELRGNLMRLTALRKMLANEQLQDFFDVCFVDTSPAIGIFSLNAIRTGTLLIPALVEAPSLKGITRLQAIIQELFKTPPAAYVLPVRYNKSYKQSQDVLAKLENRLGYTEEGGAMLSTYIRQSQDLPRSYDEGVSVFEYGGGSGRGAEDYMALFEKLVELVGEEEDQARLRAGEEAPSRKANRQAAAEEETAA